MLWRSNVDSESIRSLQTVKYKVFLRVAGVGVGSAI